MPCCVVVAWAKARAPCLSIRKRPHWHHGSPATSGDEGCLTKRAPQGGGKRLPSYRSPSRLPVATGTVLHVETMAKGVRSSGHTAQHGRCFDNSVPIGLGPQRCQTHLQEIDLPPSTRSTQSQRESANLFFVFFIVGSECRPETLSRQAFPNALLQSPDQTCTLFAPDESRNLFKAAGCGAD